MKPVMYAATGLLMPALLLAGASVTASDVHDLPSPTSVLEAGLIDISGERIGTVTIKPLATGLSVHIAVEGIAPGPHGMHLHQAGRCEIEQSFATAGSHLAGEGHAHGSHAGDLPNLIADASGNARTQTTVESLSLTDIIDSDGSALIIHASGDDLQSSPGGGAGPRIACAAFTAGNHT
ncbi:MAG: hypothetical protein DHS20C11_36960 [Lysobacteraceae bacterium]|nr:MAG: hypothetical protein DHS20C11_36960 [Xanthomonadaceae bacterium]